MKRIIIFIFLFSVGILHSQEAYSKIGLRLAKSHNPVAMSALLDSLEQFDKSFPPPLIKYYRADCSYKLKKFDDVIKICSDEIASYTKRDSLLSSFYFLKINAYRELGKFTNAIYENQKLIELFPEHVYSYHNISYLYGEMGDYKQCFMALEKAINIDPKNVSVLSNLSYYSSKIGEYNKAVSYATDGIKLSKDSSMTGALYNNRGFGKLLLKKYESALIDIDESLKYYPNNSYAYYNKALIYIQLKEFNMACINLNKIREFGGETMGGDLLKQYCEK